MKKRGEKTVYSAIIISAFLFVCLSCESIAAQHLTCSQVNTQGRACVEVRECKILNQTNSYYLLMNDVSNQGTCFWISGENIILDLNQYTIYYDQLDIPSISNKNFETDDMSGWDLSKAPGWYRKKQLKSIGYYVLVLPNSSIVLSPAFKIPRANYSFVGSVYMLGLYTWPRYSNLTIDFIRTDTGEAIPCGTGLPEMRYNKISQESDHELMGITCNIKTSDIPEVKIRITTQDGTLIDYVDFRGFLHPAIAARNGGVNPYWNHFSEMPQEVGNTKVMDIRNGNIIQGNARSGKAIVGYNTEKMILDSLKIIMQDTPNNKGIEHFGYYNPNAGNHFISNVLIEVPTVEVFNRDIIGGAIYLEGNATLLNNIVRTDTAGIFIAPRQGGGYVEGVLISGNKIEMGFTHASMARNHYGIWAGGFKKPVIKNNVLTGQGQGGIEVCQAYEGEVYNNTITIYPRCGTRFSETEALEVAGLVIRDNPGIGDSGWSINNKIYNNNVTMIVDPAKMQSECTVGAVAFWERNRYEFNQSRCGNNSIFNNTFTAINLQTEPNSFPYPWETLGRVSRAAAMDFSGWVPEQKEQFFNNVLQGNNILISSGMGLDKGFDIYNNILRKIDVGVTPVAYRMRPFEHVFNWDVGISLTDNIFENINIYDYWRDSHTSPILYKNTLAINVKDINNNPVADANILIRDISGNISAQGATNSQGKYQAIVKDFEVISYYQKPVYYNPHTITITKSGYQTFTQEVNITESEQLNIRLSSGPLQSCSAQQSEICNETEICQGFWISASDTARCCLGNCYVPIIGTCADSQKNQDETDIDCGGTICSKCANGKTCSINSDCQSNNCTSGICKEQTTPTPTPAQSNDGSGGGGGGRGTPRVCNENWSCQWGPCQDLTKKWVCRDLNWCNTTKLKPKDEGKTTVCFTKSECKDNDGDGYGEGKDCLGEDIDDNNATLNLKPGTETAQEPKIKLSLRESLYYGILFILLVAILIVIITLVKKIIILKRVNTLY